MKKVILTTGGTAGHIFPALSVAAEIKKSYPECKILFIGGSHGQERDYCQKENIDFIGLEVSGFFGRGFKAIPAMWKMFKAIFKANKILSKEKPDIVVGFGGYAAFPSLFAAKFKAIPTVLHEQNAIPGVANRTLAKIVDKVCLSLEDNTQAFPAEKTVVTGNPVRSAFNGLVNIRQEVKTKFRLLVMGGSQGAKAINDIIINSLPDFLAANLELEHQTGKADYERVVEAYKNVQADSSLVVAFIENVPSSMAKADLIVCRAGASTVAEITVAAKPAIFIPFPYATHDHQTANAKHLAEKGAAILIAENKIIDSNFSSLVINLIQDQATLHTMSCLANSLAQFDAAQKVVSVLEDLLRTKNNA